MQCPFCEENSLLTEDALDRHIVDKHPEYSEVGDTLYRKKSMIWTWAMGLTSSRYGFQGAKTKEEVLETFKYFVRELMKGD
jgi:hypothetical protein